MSVEYRGKVRARDRETSWEAASAQTTTKTAALQIRIYRELLNAGPLTDEELLIRLGRMLPVTPSGIRTRRHELELAGWVREERIPDPADYTRRITLKRPTLSGQLATVWRAVRDHEPAPMHAEPVKPSGRTKGFTVSPEEMVAASREAQRGRIVARRFARWEFGDPDMADKIIHAYTNPDEVTARLNEEMGA